MQFLPKVTCLKLVEMGCKTESNCGYDFTDHVRQLPHDSMAGWALDEFGPYTYAFTVLDFVGTSERAEKNAEILWGILQPEDDIECWIEKPYWYQCRHKCIDSKDAVAYICDAAERKG